MTNRGTVFGVNKVVGLDFLTKRPLFVSELLTSVALNDSGDLVEQRAGAVRYPVAHYEAARSLECQLTGKDFSLGLIQACTGHKSTSIANTASSVVSIDKKNAELTYSFVDANKAALSWGTYVLLYDGTNWEVFLVEDSVAKKNINLMADASLKISDATITGTATHLGNGVSAVLEGSYTPEAGDYDVIQVYPADPTATSAYMIQAQEASERPYVSLVMAAEKQGSLKSIVVPKAKCSSGFPHNFNEAVPNEYQITFMVSRAPGQSLYTIQTVERET